MWYPIIAKERFVSIFQGDDTHSSGKWLIPIPFGDPDGTWERLADAARDGRLLAVKISAPPLDEKLGHHLVCAYSKISTRIAVNEALSKLRMLGVSGDLRYKSDKATLDGRDDYLWDSVDLEARQPSR
ncbi:DUF1917 domain-containing protein [Rhizobium sp. BK176]|uniref:DUF1917 domain-containing protein n=1 Tax=Rhizobium sp. BK176 TaxID=2587071 RepID=UPI00216A71D8|nr:DUF1917 domain-containing protein [Rhizobium sp. BK176]MCS4088840.1 hypothetical protein [Rhizobium sp. BK176]